MMLWSSGWQAWLRTHPGRWTFQNVSSRTVIALTALLYVTLLFPDVSTNPARFFATRHLGRAPHCRDSPLDCGFALRPHEDLRAGGEPTRVACHRRRAGSNGG